MTCYQRLNVVVEGFGAMWAAKLGGVLAALLVFSASGAWAQDTDGDGLTDNQELNYDLNLTNALVTYPGLTLRMIDPTIYDTVSNDNTSVSTILGVTYLRTNDWIYVMQDTDRDRVSNYMELEYGLNPQSRVSTDGDGLYDDEETAYNIGLARAEVLYPGHMGALLPIDTNLTDTITGDRFGNDRRYIQQDSDGDGLNNEQELVTYAQLSPNGGIVPLNPWSSDTDNDGLGDYEEVVYFHTSPILADTITTDAYANDIQLVQNRDSDGDGISDYDEVYGVHSDPSQMDTDDDGIPDTLEVMGDPTGSGNPSTDYITHPGYSMAHFDPVLTNQLGQMFTPPRCLDLSVPAVAMGADWAGLAVPQSWRFDDAGFAANGWTIEAWYKPGVDSNGVIASYMMLGTNKVIAEIGVEDNMPYVRMDTQLGLPMKVGGRGTVNMRPLVPGRWIHIAGTWAPASRALTLYVQDDSFAKTMFLMPAVGAGQMYLGGKGNVRGGDSDRSDLLMDGHLDEVRIWSGARSTDLLHQWRARLLAFNDMNGILAYYRFDDAGRYIEDFVYRIGFNIPPDFYASPLNRTYALDSQDLNQLGLYATPWEHKCTNNWFGIDFSSVGTASWVPVVTDGPFVQPEGKPLPEFMDDEDGDGLPDWWEMMYGGDRTSMDPYADPDGDGLENIYEFYGRTNPTSAMDTNGNGVGDGQEDLDGDGLNNAAEQRAGTDPMLPDTDDDGYTDFQEISAGTSPLHPMSRPNFQAGCLNLAVLGVSGMTVPQPDRFQFGEGGWTIELWYKPSVSNATGDLFTYTGINGDSFRLCVTNGSPLGEVYAGSRVMVRAGGPETVPPMAVGEWQHLALCWAPDKNSFELYRDGFLLIAQRTLARPYIAIGNAVVGKDMTSGYLDEIRLWSESRSIDELDRWRNQLVPDFASIDATRLAATSYILDGQQLQPDDNSMIMKTNPAASMWDKPVYVYGKIGNLLRLYYRFDDAGSFVEDFSRFMDRTAYGVLANTNALMMNTAMAAPMRGTDDSDGDGLPEWWANLYQVNNWREQSRPWTAVDTRRDLLVNGTTNDTCDTPPGGWICESFTNIFPFPLPGVDQYPKPYPDCGAIVRDFTCFGSIGGFVEAEENDTMIPAKSRALYDSGVNAVMVKYVELPIAPKSAMLNLAFYNARTARLMVNSNLVMDSTMNIITNSGQVTTNYVLRVNINGNMIVNAGGVANDQMVLDANNVGSIDVARYLKSGRNKILLHAQDIGNQSWKHTVYPPSWFYQVFANVVVEVSWEEYAHMSYFWPKATMKLDCSLVTDGREVISRGDSSKFDPRTVWHGRAGTMTNSVHYADMIGMTEQHQDFGIAADPDGEGLRTYSEFLMGLNPKDQDTDNTGLLDAYRDYDGDGLSNIREEKMGTLPNVRDTDDDGVDDGAEYVQHGDPLDGNSPAHQRALSLDGTGWLAMPKQRRFAVDGWTIEMLIRPATNATACTLLERSVGKNVGGSGTNYINYGIALTADRKVRTYFTDSTGRTNEVSSLGTVRIDGTNWTHVAVSFAQSSRLLSIYLNGALDNSFATNMTPVVYGPGDAVVAAGVGYNGLMDELRFWSDALRVDEIAGRMRNTLTGSETNLLAYYRFDDGGLTAQDNIDSSRGDWVRNWENAARYMTPSGPSTTGLPLVDQVLRDVPLVDDSGTIIEPPVVTEDDADHDGLPDVWESIYGLSISSPYGVNGAWGDPDKDGLPNRAEWLAGTKPNDPLSFNGKYPDFFGYVTNAPNAYRIFGELYTDHDRMNDEWEWLTGLDPMSYDSQLDSDGDGWSNLAEFQAGYNVTNCTFANPIDTNAPNPMVFNQQPKPMVTFKFKMDAMVEDFRKSGRLQVMGYRTPAMDGNPALLVTIPGSEPRYYPISYTTNQFTGVASVISSTNVVGTNTVVSTATNMLSTTLWEGDAYFFAFIDNDNNGMWGAGEPAAVAERQPVDVGWSQVPEISFGLTVDQPDARRSQYALAGYKRFSWPSIADVGKYKVYIRDTDGMEVMKREILGPRNWFHEGDYRSQGVNGLSPFSSYQWFVYVENETTPRAQGAIVTWSPTNAIQPVVVQPLGNVPYTSTEFKWRTPQRGHTEFILECATNTAFTDVVRREQIVTPYPELDPVSSNYVHSYKVLFPMGDEPGCFAADKLYYWRVTGRYRNNSMQASVPQYHTDVSAATAFRLDFTNSPLVYSVSGQLIYFGKVTNGTWVVEAYPTADCRGTPVAAQWLKNEGYVTTSSWPWTVVPFKLQGLRTGTVYVRAFLDQNANRRYDVWETMGYIDACMSVPKAVVLPPSATSQQIWMMVADTDNDRIADDWETERFGNLTEAGLGTSHGISGLSDYDAYANGPLNLNPNDPNAAGVDGVPLRIKKALGFNLWDLLKFEITGMTVNGAGYPEVTWKIAGVDLSGLPAFTYSGGCVTQLLDSANQIGFRVEQMPDMNGGWSNILNGTISFDPAAQQFKFTGITPATNGFFRYNTFFK